MKSNEIIPLRNYIVVERAKPEKYVGRIALPDIKNDDKTVLGTVIAVGPGVYDVKVLDTITFPKYCNKEFIVNEKKYLLIQEAEVFAVVE